MFNRKNNVLLVMTILIALGTASAASAGGSIFAGANFPTGGFGDDASTGWTLGGYYTADVMPIIDIGGLVSYNDWSIDIGDTPGVEDILGDSINAWEVHALGQLSFLMLKGYLGLGFANYNFGGGSADTSRETDFSWQIGLSMNLAMLEARLGYHQIPVEEYSINWVSLTLGLKF
jgi:hypothetical protein